MLEPEPPTSRAAILATRIMTVAITATRFVTISTLAAASAVAQVDAQTPAYGAFHEQVESCERIEHGEPRRALEIASEIESAIGSDAPAALRARMHGCRAWALATLGRMPEAMAELRAIEALEGRVAEPVDRLRVKRRIASLHHRLGDVQRSIERLGDALEYSRTHDLGEAGVELYTSLGTSHAEAENFDLAIEYFERALGSMNVETAPHRRLPVLYNLGLTYRNAGEFESAIRTLEQLLEPLQEPGMEIRLASLNAILGAIHRERGDLDAAEAALDRAEALHQDLDNPGEYAALLIDRTYLALARERNQQALAYSQSALENARTGDYYFTLRGALRARVAALEAVGDFESALELQREYSKRTEDYMREQQRSELNQLQATLGYERQEAELAELRQARERQEFELRQQRFGQQVLFGIGASLIVLGIGAIVWQRIVNRRLARLSRTDSLTGLPNRRHVSEWLDALDASGEHPEAIMLVDLDRFKQVNDSFGHHVGDRALVELARLLQAFCADHQARAGRWGGEEFVVITPVEGSEQACERVETLRRRISEMDLRAHSDRAIPITASIGFTPLFGLRSHSGQNQWEPALLIADQLLYRAKQAGRNTWIGIWPSGPDANVPNQDLDQAIRDGRCELLGAGGQG